MGFVHPMPGTSKATSATRRLPARRCWSKSAFPAPALTGHAKIWRPKFPAGISIRFGPPPSSNGSRCSTPFRFSRLIRTCAPLSMPICIYPAWPRQSLMTWMAPIAVMIIKIMPEPTFKTTPHFPSGTSTAPNGRYLPCFIRAGSMTWCNPCSPNITNWASTPRPSGRCAPMKLGA